MKLTKDHVRIAAISVISPALVNKFKIPELSLKYDGGDAPEGSIFLQRGEASSLGEVVLDPRGDEELLVVTHNLHGGWLATAFGDEDVKEDVLEASEEEEERY